MEEENIDLPYKSVTNCAHMCGHDGHTSILLGTAQLLHKNKDKIGKNQLVRLLFQPAEEVGFGGALPMVEEGCLVGIDEVYGLHAWPLYEPGMIGVKVGEIMAGFASVEITIRGKGGHSAYPEECDDVILTAAYVHKALNSL